MYADVTWQVAADRRARLRRSVSQWSPESDTRRNRSRRGGRPSIDPSSVDPF